MLTWNNLEELTQRGYKRVSKNNILFWKIERKGSIKGFMRFSMIYFYFGKLMFFELFQFSNVENRTKPTVDAFLTIFQDNL